MILNADVADEWYLIEMEFKMKHKNVRLKLDLGYTFRIVETRNRLQEVKIRSFFDENDVGSTRAAVTT